MTTGTATKQGAAGEAAAGPAPDGGTARVPPGVEHDVGYVDTDAGGIVYHGKYVELAERARNALLHDAGFTYKGLLAEHGILMVIHRVEADYHAPAWLEDRLRLVPHIGRCRAARTLWVTEVMRGETPIATIRIEIVAVDAETRKLTRHPEALVESLARYVPVKG
ncbi:MAG: YbgC/FadM family acyl-CoA thioesterase [Azospirillaceae bacterium]